MTTFARTSRVVASAVGVLLADEARAEPRFALETGLACAACHVDPAGGGLATDRGLAWAKDDLATYVPPGAWDPHIGAIVRIGAALRVEDEVTLPAKTTLDDVPFEAPGANTFALSEVSLRLQVEPIADHLSVVVDEDLNAAKLNTAYVLARGPSDAWLKAGWIAQRWGLGLRPGTALAQEATLVSERPGLEVGATKGPLSLALALTSAAPIDGRLVAGERLSAIAEVRGAAWFCGVSAATDNAADVRFPVSNNTGAVHAGATVGPVRALAEVDVVRGKNTAEVFTRAASYVELNLEVHPGVYVQGAYDRYDPLLAVAENARDRITLGGTWYVVRHVAIEARLRVRRDIPQLPEGNADTVLIGVRGSL